MSDAHPALNRTANLHSVGTCASDLPRQCFAGTAVCLILHLTFDQIDWREEFDGVWACASLLHLPALELQTALRRIIGSLRRGGVLYVSLKEGHFEGMREERWFTDSTAAGIRRLLVDTDALDAIRLWETADARPGTTTTWVNALARRSASPV